ncbi:hypothetical protein AL035_11045 [Salipiger aestuarii]|uniref:Uncharacterized protein n=1 Tax=Salipiger aestuarii TaxID=568098 RepID=A0A327Y2H6_9RHOB|nr:hypothetical protein [Salipiger aestuarii]KAB2541707.1 hypothetical protein AL035_11045 [Salipiger aestuarii]RAK15290.1 hypothetical protein ATI53_102446 [Salipiger aestuarii]
MVRTRPAATLDDIALAIPCRGSDATMQSRGRGLRIRDVLMPDREQAAEADYMHRAAPGRAATKPAE